MDAEAALGTEIPYASATGKAVLDQNVGRKFVRGVDEAACGLEPGHEAAMRFEVPAKNDGGKTDSGEGSPTRFYTIGVVEASRGIVDGFGLASLRRGEGLPVRHDFTGNLGLTAKDAGGVGAG